MVEIREAGEIDMGANKGDQVLLEVQDPCPAEGQKSCVEGVFPPLQSHGTATIQGSDRSRLIGLEVMEDPPKQSLELFRSRV